MRGTRTREARCICTQKHWFTAPHARRLIHVRSLLDKIGTELGIKQVRFSQTTKVTVNQRADWCRVSRRAIVSKGGGALFLKHKSVEDLVRAAYPEEEWERHRFAKQSGPNGYWKDNANLFKAMDKAELLLGISKVKCFFISGLCDSIVLLWSQPEDWYSVTMSDLKQTGLSGTIVRSKLLTLLSEKYPDHKWEKLYLLKGRYAQQHRLQKAVYKFFPVSPLKSHSPPPPPSLSHPHHK